MLRPDPSCEIMTLVHGSRGDGGYGGLLGYVRLPLEVAKLFDGSLAMVSGYFAVWEFLAKQNISG